MSTSPVLNAPTYYTSFSPNDTFLDPIFFN